MRYKEFKRLAESANVQDNGILEGAAWTKKAGKKSKKGGEGADDASKTGG